MTERTRGGRALGATVSGLLVIAASCRSAEELDRAHGGTRYSAETLMSTHETFVSDVSPDRRWVLGASNSPGTFQLFAYPVAAGLAPRQLTSGEHGRVSPRGWFPHDERVLYESDDGGDERMHVKVLEPDGSVVDLTPGDGVEANFLRWRVDGASFWVGIDEPGVDGTRVYRYEADGYRRELVYEAPGDRAVRSISANGRWVVLAEFVSNVRRALYAHDLVEGRTLRITPDLEDVTHRYADLSPDSQEVLYTTDEHGEFRQAWSYDLETGERSLAYATDWDVRRCRFSPLGTYLIVDVVVDALPMTRLVERPTGKRLELPPLPFGVGVLGPRFSPDETALAVHNAGTQMPLDIFFVDRPGAPDAEVRQLTRSLDPSVDVRDLIEAEPVHFLSGDGLQIPGFVYRPLGARAAAPAPAVVYLHGGPGGLAPRVWHAELQHLANHGHVVFVVNYRGSESYGRSFLRLDDRRHAEVILPDILAARDWLAAKDWVDADRIALMGASFGGFLTLHTLFQEPRSFVAGVAHVGPINWISTLEIAEDRIGPAIAWQHAEIGHPVEDAERLRRVSPYFHSDRIVRPLLLAYGANDRRYAQHEIDEFVASIRARGVPVEHLTFAAEGHMIMGKQSLIELQRATLRFLQRWLSE